MLPNITYHGVRSPWLLTKVFVYTKGPSSKTKEVPAASLRLREAQLSPEPSLLPKAMPPGTRGQPRAQGEAGSPHGADAPVPGPTAAAVAPIVWANPQPRPLG